MFLLNPQSLPSDAPIYQTATPSGNMEQDATVQQSSEQPQCSSPTSNSETTLSPSLCPRPPEEHANIDKASDNQSGQNKNQFKTTNSCHQKSASTEEFDDSSATQIKNLDTGEKINLSQCISENEFLCKDSNENIASKSEGRDKISDLSIEYLKVIISSI